LKKKEEELKKHLDLKNLGLSHLKDFSIKDLAHFEVPEKKTVLEKLKHIIPKDLDPSHHKEVDEFWTGVFDNFRLPKPTDLINCFGSVSGPVFFRKLRAVNDLLQHTKNHENLKLHTDYVQFEVLNNALEHAHNCMYETKDYERLMDAMHVPNDPKALDKVKHLYSQAKFASLADEYKPVIDEADRIIDEFKQDWLNILDNAVGLSNKIKHDFQPYMLSQSYSYRKTYQKLLFSATLTHNPEILQQLNLFRPILFSSLSSSSIAMPSRSTYKKSFSRGQLTDEPAEEPTRASTTAFNKSKDKPHGNPSDNDYETHDSGNGESSPYGTSWLGIE